MTALSALLRKTPGEGLREYFDRPEIDLPVEIDWSVRDADLPGPLMSAIEEMSRVQRDRVVNDAERVTALTDGPGQAAIYSVAEGPAFLDGLANPHARSLWMFINAPDRFRHAEEVRFTEDRRRGRMWAGYMSEPGRGVPRDTSTGLAHVAGPHAPPPPVLREADLFGMAEPVGRVDEHPERPRMRVGETVEKSGALCHAVDRRLSGPIGQRGDPLGVVHHPVALDPGHLLDGAHERAGKIGIPDTPVDLDRKVDFRPVEIFPKPLAGGLAKQC